MEWKCKWMHVFLVFSFQFSNAVWGAIIPLSSTYLEATKLDLATATTTTITTTTNDGFASEVITSDNKIVFHTTSTPNLNEVMNSEDIIMSTPAKLFSEDSTSAMVPDTARDSRVTESPNVLTTSNANANATFRSTTSPVEEKTTLQELEQNTMAAIGQNTPVLTPTPTESVVEATTPVLDTTAAIDPSTQEEDVTAADTPSSSTPSSHEGQDHSISFGSAAPGIDSKPQVIDTLLPSPDTTTTTFNTSTLEIQTTTQTVDISTHLDIEFTTHEISRATGEIETSAPTSSAAAETITHDIVITTSVVETTVTTTPIVESATSTMENSTQETTISDVETTPANAKTISPEVDVETTPANDQTTSSEIEIIQEAENFTKFIETTPVAEVTSREQNTSAESAEKVENTTASVGPTTEEVKVSTQKTEPITVHNETTTSYFVEITSRLIETISQEAATTTASFEIATQELEITSATTDGTIVNSTTAATNTTTSFIETSTQEEGATTISESSTGINELNISTANTTTPTSLPSTATPSVRVPTIRSTQNTASILISTTPTQELRPPFYCYECHSGAPDAWQNDLCPANGTIQGWAAQAIHCNGPCVSVVMRYPRGDVYRACSNNYWFPFERPTSGCIMYNQDFYCFCSGDRCNIRNLEAEQKGMLGVTMSKVAPTISAAGSTSTTASSTKTTTTLSANSTTNATTIINQPLYKCYECHSGAPGYWQNNLCPPNGSIQGWAADTTPTCMGPCVSVVTRHPKGDVYRACSNNYWFPFEKPASGCITHNQVIYCFCSGDRCNTRNMSAELRFMLESN